MYGRRAIVTVSGDAAVNRLLMAFPRSTPVLVRVNVRYLKYPSSRVRSLRRTTVIRKVSTSLLMRGVGTTVTTTNGWWERGVCGGLLYSRGERCNDFLMSLGIFISGG